MRTTITLFFFLLLTNLIYSQKSVLDIKNVDELTKQDMYLLGQTYAESSYKRTLGNGVAGFFFGFIAKGITSSSKKDAKKILKLISSQKNIPPLEVLKNKFFIDGFNLAWKQKALNDNRQGELISYFGVLIILFSN